MKQMFFCSSLAFLWSNGMLAIWSHIDLCNAGDPSLIPGSRRSTGEGTSYPLQYSWASPVAQPVKNPSAMWETWVWSMVVKIPWRRERLPTPVFWHGEFHGLYSAWGCKESDRTLTFTFTSLSLSFAFPKSSLNIWKFLVHILLKSHLENFEHYFASMWDEYNCAVVWTFFGSAFLWDWNETDLF